ncbi:MAG TPA: CaiB/BaiF CoA-transferase family protein [Solirubrobacterales bacterium]
MPAAEQAESRGPLSGVRVVELAGIGPAQLGTLMLSDLGADVVRIDRPAGALDLGGEAGREVLGRGRRSIGLDLRQPEDLATAWKLIERADVLVDPYRPGVAERLGVGPEEALERNPGLVYARMTGWGQDGPLAAAAGHDINYIALAGALGQIGDADRPPAVPLNLVADFGGGGMLMAVGVLAALHERRDSGRGQMVDAAMVDGVASLLGSVLQLRAMGLWQEGRGANWLQGAAPWYRAYETADGRYVSVGALEPKFYAELLQRLDLDPAAWPQHDEERWPALAAAMAERFASRSLEEWQGELEGTDACFAPVLELEEAARHPHLAARGTFVERDGMLQPGVAPKLSRTPGAIAGPPPLPDQHGAELRAELAE